MQLMSIEDLAVYLGDSKRTIYKYIASGDCPPYIKISTKNIKFDRADVDVWLESKKVIPKLGGKKMTDLKMIGSTNDLIKNVVRRGKLRWMQRAQEVIKFAKEQAGKDGFEFVGTEHVLLGIVSVKECLGQAILNNLGVTRDKCKQLYDKVCQSTDKKPSGKAMFSEDIEKVIDYAYEQANEWGHEYIGAEHLLVGILLAGKGIGFQMLTKLRITPDMVSEETQKHIVCRNVKNERKER
jgi:excisionase family DNA binding protein